MYRFMLHFIGVSSVVEIWYGVVQGMTLSLLIGLYFFFRALHYTAEFKK